MAAAWSEQHAGHAPDGRGRGRGPGFPRVLAHCRPTGSAGWSRRSIQASSSNTRGSGSSRAPSGNRSASSRSSSARPGGQAADPAGHQGRHPLPGTAAGPAGAGRAGPARRRRRPVLGAQGVQVLAHGAVQVAQLLAQHAGLEGEEAGPVEALAAVLDDRPGPRPCGRSPRAAWPARRCARGRAARGRGSAPDGPAPPRAGRAPRSSSPSSVQSGFGSTRAGAVRATRAARRRRVGRDRGRASDRCRESTRPARSPSPG